MSKYSRWVSLLYKNLYDSLEWHGFITKGAHLPSVPPPIHMQTWTTVLMFDRSLWKLSLALYVHLARWWGCDIIFWIFTPVSAPRRQKQESTWPSRTAVCPPLPTHTHALTHILPLCCTAMLKLPHAHIVNIQLILFCDHVSCLHCISSGL